MAYQILSKNCIGCSACVMICPTDAITGDNKEIHYIDPEICINCGACGKICQFEAILNSEKALCFPLPKKAWRIPAWDHERCTACNICLYACPVNAIEEDLYTKTNRFNFSLNKQRCIGCGFCCQACPIGVIFMTSRSSASLTRYGTSSIFFYTMATHFSIR